MGALALAVLAATIFACSKEKESATQQPTGTETARKPIATFDNATGRMTYHVSVGQLQNAVDNHTASKSIGEVIVESWSIIDDESSENPVLMLSVIDVVSESSSKIAMYNTFVEQVSVGNATEYYLTDLIRSGNYNYITSDAKDSYLVTVENNEVVSVELYNAKGPQTDGVVLTCETTGCGNSGGCDIDKEKGECTPCYYGTCKQTKSTIIPAPALEGFSNAM
jgi:hypothetical protein